MVSAICISTGIRPSLTPTHCATTQATAQAAPSALPLVLRESARLARSGCEGGRERCGDAAAGRLAALPPRPAAAVWAEWTPSTIT